MVHRSKLVPIQVGSTCKSPLTLHARLTAGFSVALRDLVLGLAWIEGVKVMSDFGEEGYGTPFQDTQQKTELKKRNRQQLVSTYPRAMIVNSSVNGVALKVQ